MGEYNSKCESVTDVLTVATSQRDLIAVSLGPIAYSIRRCFSSPVSWIRVKLLGKNWQIILKGLVHRQWLVS